MFQTIGKCTALIGSALMIAMAAASAQAADGPHGCCKRPTR